MDAGTAPLVSVLIRSMDRPTLARGLDSAAAQTWPNLEIVVVAASGESHPALPDAWHERPLRLVVAPDGAPLPRAAAANLCLESARGAWLNFLDDDDELLPDHLETLVRAARAGDERVLFAKARVVDLCGRSIGQAGSAGNHVQLYFQSRATPCAMLLHRSLVDDGVRFDTAFAVHEDHDFQVDCATRTQFRFVDAETSVWHAQAGASGCGFGANDDNDRRRRAVQRIRAKWVATFELWLTDADAVLYAGQQYLKNGNLALAIPCFDQVLHLRPGDVNALNLGGVAHLRNGDLAQAEQWLRRAAARLPRHAGIRENLQLVLARRNAAQDGGKT